MGKNAPSPEGLQRSIQATKVEYKQLGKCGLRVSVPILGGMSFGHKDWMEWVVDNENAVMDLLKAAWDRGLNTWDTANVYSNGLSEEMIGRAIKKLEIPRQKIVLMTKCWGTVGEEPGLLFLRNPEMLAARDYINQGGLSRAAIFNAVNASLRRLDTHYIDLLQIHRYDASVPVEETMKALHDLVEAGKVRYIGASSMWTYQFARMQFVAESRGWTKFVSMQNQYSLCYREEEREMIKFCHETGVGLVPWSPLRSGFLARPLEAQPTLRSEFTKNTTILPDGDKLYSEADREINHRVEELANKKGWKMSQVALIWAVQRGTVPIVGFNSVARVEEATELTGKSLTDAEMAYLEEPYIPKQVSGHV